MSAVAIKLQLYSNFKLTEEFNGFEQPNYPGDTIEHPVIRQGSNPTLVPRKPAKVTSLKSAESWQNLCTPQVCFVHLIFCSVLLSDASLARHREERHRSKPALHQEKSISATLRHLPRTYDCIHQELFAQCFSKPTRQNEKSIPTFRHHLTRIYYRMPNQRGYLRSKTLGATIVRNVSRITLANNSRTLHTPQVCFTHLKCSPLRVQLGPWLLYRYRGPTDPSPLLYARGQEHHTMTYARITGKRKTNPTNTRILGSISDKTFKNGC